MAILNRDMFLQIQEELAGQKSELVEIAPGIEVQVVQLTAEAGFGLFNLADSDPADKRNEMGTFRWVAACCRGEDGVQVFSVDDLRQMPLEIVQKLAQAVNRVNGLANPDSIEEAEKNSNTAIS